MPPSNPAKTIFGAQFDVELGNIATAIASKYDTASLATLFPQVKANILSASVTSRTSTTTLSNDANLQYAITAAGTYQVDVIFYVSSTSSGGISFNLNYSGTIGNGGNAIVSVSQFGFGSITQNSNSGGLVANTVTTAAYTATAAGSIGLTFKASTLVTVTTAGTIALAWAQQSSNSTAVNINQGSSMLVIRVA